MRFRYSHTARLRLMNERNQRRQHILYAGLVTAVVVLVAIAAWVLMYENQARGVVYWLLDRPLPVTLQEDARTAAWKSDQLAYHALDAAVYGALINLQVTPGRIQDTKPRMMIGGSRWTPVERRIIVSGGYSLTECNLEISRAVTRAGGTVVRAAERSRTRELLLEIALDGKVTHHLQISRDADLERKKGRMAVVIAYTDGSHRGVVGNLLEFPRPITFALAPWAAGAGDIAGDLAQANHEVIALLPVEPKSFTGNVTRRRSVLASNTETANRRIVEDALASLPTARGVLGYPGGPMDDEAAALAAVLDELGKRGKYFVDARGTAESSAGPDMPEVGSGRLRAWGMLDPVYNPVIISMNLDRASLSALENAGAIVIAHARPHTFQVLMNRMARLETRGIEFVRVSDLLDN